MKKITVSLSAFFVSFVLSAQDAGKEDVIEITASPITVKDNVETYPEKIRLAQPAVTPVINDSLQKLPGALVTQFSGPGSQSAIISPFAMGSGGTLTTIDGIPIQAPLGRGNDLVFFPPSFFKAVDWYSPYYPWSEGLTTSGGRLDLITKDAPTNEIEVTGSALYGTAHTAQVSTSASSGGDSGPWLFGLTGFRTDGDFNYKDPYTGEQKNRSRNDSRYVAGIGKKEWTLSEDASLSFLAVTQVGHRTDPGSITNIHNPGFGGGNGHHTFFGIVGSKLKLKNSWLENHGQNVIASYAVTRNYYNNVPQFVTPFLTRYTSGGENTENGFFAYQWEGRQKRNSWFAQIDGQYERVEAYYPLEKNRQTFGFTLSYDGIHLSERDYLIPRVRAEQSSTLGFSPDVGLSYIHQIDKLSEFFAGAHFIHRSPSMIHLYGYSEGGIPILGNPDLPNERIQMYSVGYNYTGERMGLWLTSWYSLHKNVGLRTTLQDGTGTFDNVPEAYTLGGMAHFSWSFASQWHFRQSALLQRGENLKTNKYLTFKPMYVFNSSLNYDVLENLSVGIENLLIGARYFSSANTRSDGPVNTTQVRADAKLGPGVGYFKVANIFDSSGYDNPGYPLPGRSYWIGYSVDSL